MSPEFLRNSCLLCGGDKGSQNRDIENAKQLAKEWRE